MERLDIEANPSSILATEIAEAINGFIGKHEWQGDMPFEVHMANEAEGLVYIFAIRRGENWITIQKRVSDNPSLVRTFFLEKEGDNWTYVDSYLIKYGKSSLDQLQAAFDTLKIAIEVSAPRKISGA